MTQKNGFISLRFEEKDNAIHVIVEDNGVGYEKSKKQKSKVKKIHKSMASKILKERIDIFNYLNENKTSFSILSEIKENVEVGTVAQLKILLLFQVSFRGLNSLPKKLAPLFWKNA